MTVVLLLTGMFMCIGTVHVNSFYVQVIVKYVLLCMEVQRQREDYILPSIQRSIMGTNVTST